MGSVAAIITAGVGADRSRFSTPGHLALQARLTPG